MLRMYVDEQLCKDDDEEYDEDRNNSLVFSGEIAA